MSAIITKFEYKLLMTAFSKSTKPLIELKITTTITLITIDQNKTKKLHIAIQIKIIMQVTK